MLLTDLLPLPHPDDTGTDPTTERPAPDAVYDAFLQWTRQRDISLYPAQDEAAMELVQGHHVILSTPTGSGKSLVAVAAHALAWRSDVAATTPPRSRPWSRRSSSRWWTSSAPRTWGWSPATPR